MVIVKSLNIPHAYNDVLWAIKIHGKREESRNGPVLAMPGPFTLIVEQPYERVLLDPVRQANPYFHVMEFVWMMSGSKDVEWLSNYNKRMLSYSDDGKILKGAYGNRWRSHFQVDQILWVINLLKKDPTTRRAVIAMYDPAVDTSYGLDIPCNTHIYLRIQNKHLHMTVCNRSNDIMWGMLGANAVHMTLLHELISRAVGVEQGEYIVMSNNAHVYVDVPNFSQVDCPPGVNEHHYTEPDYELYPLLAAGEDPETFLSDAVRFVTGKSLDTKWMREVAAPMRAAYEARLADDETAEMAALRELKADDWFCACMEWKGWKK